MALSPRLEVRQSQSLTLTPQLMQSIRLLQLSHLELNAFVDTELLRNPLLEREDGTEAVETPEPVAEVTAYDDAVVAGERIQGAEAIAQSFDTEVENVFPEQRGEDRLGTDWGSGGGGADGAAPDIDQYIAARPTLADHLNAQIGLLLTDPADRLIARFLADGLNEAGYLAIELETVAEQLGASIAAIRSSAESPAPLLIAPKRATAMKKKRRKLGRRIMPARNPAARS